MKEQQDNEANRLNIKEYIKSYIDSLKERTSNKHEQNTETKSLGYAPDADQLV